MVSPLRGDAGVLGDLVSSCSKWTRYLLLIPPKFPSISASDKQSIAIWNDVFTQSGGIRLSDIHFDEDRSLYALAQLPEHLNKEIFFPEGKDLSKKHLEARLAQFGISSLHPAFRNLLNRVCFRPKKCSSQIEGRIQNLLAKPKEELDAIQNQIQRRIKIAEIATRLFTDVEGKIVGDKLVFPDGEFNIVGRKEDGSLLIEVDYRLQVRPTQDYLNPNIVTEHGLIHGKTVFWGELIADGTVLIWDQHHRIAAAHRKNQGKVIFHVQRSAAGQYHARSLTDLVDFYVSQFSFRYWNKLEDAELDKYLDRVRRDTEGLGRELYYKVFPHKRLRAPNFH